MVQVLPKPVTFEQFAEWYPDTGVRYELHNGVIVEMNQPSGDHEMVIALLSRKLTVEVDKKNLPYVIPKSAFVKPPTTESAYCPDIVLLNPLNLVNEPLWQKHSTLTQSASIPLVAEVVSTNWQTDYANKANDYEVMGIPEYWILDYLGLGGRRFIGSPKQPTLSIYSLIDGEYQVSQFRGDEVIISPTFPELRLTAGEVLLIQ
ncbi:Uma2 family endonuclease [Sphaerospermopsis sp. LEGE 08334]|jgi:Uma2 family endonuclease|uniref:Uma2 family endonuclease n=1 Tax=Sphaerospermopsis sp. LEGE 08334 TaxID=1828651 RepID=UPI001880FB7C|nr:Uma2 family endonuclease [Sphaerospermopsis sp. LEGE 08334]MBE9059205.1 Uma2 family endonuclease [Sphaerospermopsis sp. LEGE 08334]